MSQPTKPGYASTEVYIAGGTSVALALALTNDGSEWVRAACALGLALIGAVYVAFRTKAKNGGAK